MMEDQEKRRRTRVSYKTLVDIKTDTTTLANLQIKDLSLKGIYVEADNLLQMDTMCKLTIKLSDSPEMFLHLTGKVVRLDGKGMGIEFDTMDAGSFYHLKKIVTYNLDDPEKALKEIAGVPFNRVA